MSNQTLTPHPAYPARGLDARSAPGTQGVPILGAAQCSNQGRRAA